MKKIILKTGLVLGAIFLLSGCGAKYNYIQKHTKSDNHSIEAMSSFSTFGITNKKYTNSTYAVIQQASEFVISKDYNYFTITSPGPVANTQGIIMNTAKEFIDKCSAGGLAVFSGGLDDCLIHKGTNGWYAKIWIKCSKNLRLIL